MDREREQDEAHDILAAEAFAMGEGDKQLHRESAHDVLAAEAFAMGGADRGRTHAPRDEHSDDAAPHDVLSAEEYAMPAGTHHSVPPGAAGGRRRDGIARRLLMAGAGLIVLRRVLGRVRG